MEDILSYEQVREGVRDVINAHPEGTDHVYSPPGRLQACMYVHDDKPSCVVGHYLINGLGVDANAIQNHEGIGASSLIETLYVKGFMSEMDYWATMFLDVIQREQDCGAPWGEAYETASFHVESRRKNEQ